MSNVAIVYHSGFGHTQALADAIARGIQSVPGATATLIPVDEAEARAGELDAADAIVFGSPTYMGGISAEFARFKDWTSKRWLTRAWQNKLASGFTVSASWGGDKHGTLHLLRHGFKDRNAKFELCQFRPANRKNDALYFSREAIPSRKMGAKTVPMLKQVCN